MISHSEADKKLGKKMLALDEKAREALHTKSPEAYWELCQQLDDVRKFVSGADVGSPPKASAAVLVAGSYPRPTY